MQKNLQTNKSITRILSIIVNKIISKYGILISKYCKIKKISLKLKLNILKIIE